MAPKRRRGSGLAAEEPAVSGSANATGASGETMLQKALVPNAGWDKESFEDFYDVIYWLRQAVAVVVGISFGLLPVTGATGLGGFIGLNTLIPFFYYSKYAKVDEDDFGRMELLKEGFQPSVGLFLTTWILFYHIAYGQFLAEVVPEAAAPVPPAN